MGWTERDWAKWTPEERRRFYGGGSGAPPRSDPPLSFRRRRSRRRIGPWHVLLVLILAVVAAVWSLDSKYVPSANSDGGVPHTRIPTALIPQSASLPGTSTFVEQKHCVQMTFDTSRNAWFCTEVAALP
jgi:hypothetical protein